MCIEKVQKLGYKIYTSDENIKFDISLFILYCLYICINLHLVLFNIVFLYFIYYFLCSYI